MVLPESERKYLETPLWGEKVVCNITLRCFPVVRISIQRGNNSSASNYKIKAMPTCLAEKIRDPNQEMKKKNHITCVNFLYTLC